MALDPVQASLNGRIGAAVLHSRYSGAELTRNATAAARASLDTRLLAEIDERSPGLSDDERMRRLGHARREHFLRLSKRGAEARRRKATRRRKRSPATA